MPWREKTSFLLLRSLHNGRRTLKPDDDSVKPVRHPSDRKEAAIEEHDGAFVDRVGVINALVARPQDRLAAILAAVRARS